MTKLFVNVIKAACAALALCVALPLLAAPKHHPRSRPQPPPRIEPLPSGVTVETRQAKPGEVAALYQSLLLAHCPAATFGQPDPASAPAEPPDARYRGDCFRFTVASGPMQGLWEFPAPAQGDAAPTIARRIEFPADATSYWAKATITCEQASDACRQYASDTRRMSPPNPSSFVARDSAQQKGWPEAIGNEPCEPGPIHTEAPEYPREELNNGITGTVVMLLLANNCGEVRQVLIEKSSGSRAIDRAALGAALHWRVDVRGEADPNQHFHWKRAPISFSL